MKRAFLFLIIYAFCSLNIRAQDSAYKRIDKFLANMNMDFNLPRDYIVQKSDFYFGCDAFLSAPIHYTIINKNKNILIGIYFGKPPSAKELLRINNEIPVFHKKKAFYPDSNYIYGAKAMADTMNHRLIYLDHNFVRKRNNADRGAIYIRNCGAPNYLVFEDNHQNVVTDYEYKKAHKGEIIRTYNHNKIVTIAKDGRGHIELVYLYTDKITDNEINKEILATSKMLRFNN